jgi:hypothetical protein
MNKFISTSGKLFLALPLLFLIGCPQSQSPESIARDAIGGAAGFLGNEQTIHLSECQAAPTKPLCQSINRGIAAQHTLADALIVYCSGAPTIGPAYKDGGNCVPVRDAAAALQSAVVNLNDIISQIKTLLGSTVKTAWMRDLDAMQAYLGRTL